MHGDHMADLIAYGTYVPRHRLERSSIGAVLGSPAGKGSRSVAGYDEDATSMAVEAGRDTLRTVGAELAPTRLLYATASPPYLDKTNANVVHAALRLDTSALAVDMMGSVRSGVGALLLAAEAPGPTLAVLSDIRTGLPGSADEREGATPRPPSCSPTGAEPIARVIAQASSTDEFLDRWRLPGAPASRVWEERFGEHIYLPLADAAFADALKRGRHHPRRRRRPGGGRHPRSSREGVLGRGRSGKGGRRPDHHRR